MMLMLLFREIKKYSQKIELYTSKYGICSENKILSQWGALVYDRGKFFSDNWQISCAPTL